MLEVEGWKQGNVQRAAVLGNTEHNLVEILVNESSILLNVVSIASCSLTSVHGNLCWIFKIPNLLKRENWNNGVLKLDLNQLVSYCLAAAGLGWAGLGWAGDTPLCSTCDQQQSTPASQHQVRISALFHFLKSLDPNCPNSVSWLNKFTAVKGQFWSTNSP